MNFFNYIPFLRICKAKQTDFSLYRIKLRKKSLSLLYRKNFKARGLHRFFQFAVGSRAQKLPRKWCSFYSLPWLLRLPRTIPAYRQADSHSVRSKGHHTDHFFHGVTLLMSLGNIAASRTFLKPRRCIVSRSSPKPNPPCGGAPYLWSMR